MSQIEIELIRETRQIVKLAEKKIGLLVDQAKKRNRKIYLRPRAGGVYIGTALQEIPINKSVIKKILCYLPLAKKHWGTTPETLLELVDSSGGIKKTITRLDNARGQYSFWSNGSYEADYLESLSYILRQCIVSCNSDYKSTQKEFRHPFCTLCWRERASSSNYYCSNHSQNRKLRQNDKRKIQNALRERDSSIILDNRSRLPNLISHFVNLYSTDPVKLLKYTTKQEISDMQHQDWRKLGALILQFVQDTYPYAYEKIKDIKPSDSSDWISWLTKIRWFLDKNDANSENIEQWLQFKNNQHDWLILLTVIQRCNAYYQIQTTKLKQPGPQIGQVPKNEAIRKKILVIAKEQIKERGKTNAAEIGRAVKISRQRVNILLKEIFAG